MQSVHTRTDGKGAMPANNRRSSYIDQWRGLSVLLVIANHLILFRFNNALLIDKGTTLLQKVRYKILWFVDLWGINAGMVGVCIFFVISGYLITYLMLKEADQSGVVSLRAFYVRRTFRILPALLLYILGIWLLDVVGVIQTERARYSPQACFSATQQQLPAAITSTNYGV